MATAHQYDLLQTSAYKKLLDLTNDTIKVMLCTNAYTPNQATHQFKSDVTNEVTGTGYTAGGQALVSPALSLSAHVTKFTASNPSWSSSTITARYAVYYDSTPATDATRPLLAFVDFGSDFVSTSGPFTITIDTLGILSVTTT